MKIFAPLLAIMIISCTELVQNQEVSIGDDTKVANIYPYYKKSVLVACESDIQEIKKILGEPHFVTIEQVPNLHAESQLDEIHELAYDGLTILVYVLGNPYYEDQTNLIVGFTLTGKQYQLPGNIKIGSSWRQVKKSVMPLKSVKNFFLYKNTFEEGYEEDVHFYSSENRLSKVVWECPID